MKTVGRVPAFLLFSLFAIGGLAACDPKDLYGPEEGPPQPVDDFFVPTPSPFTDGTGAPLDIMNPGTIRAPVELPAAE